jgi:hypothetical protein
MRASLNLHHKDMYSKGQLCCADWTNLLVFHPVAFSMTWTTSGEACGVLVAPCLGFAGHASMVETATNHVFHAMMVLSAKK